MEIGMEIASLFPDHNPRGDLKMTDVLHGATTVTLIGLVAIFVNSVLALS